MVDDKLDIKFNIDVDFQQFADELREIGDAFHEIADKVEDIEQD